MWVAADGPRPRRSVAACSTELEARAAAGGSRIDPARDQPDARRGDRASTARPAIAEVDAFNDEPYAHHWFEKRLHTE